MTLYLLSFAWVHQRHRQFCICHTAPKGGTFYAPTHIYNKLLMAREGVLYAENSTRGGVERTIQHEANSRAITTTSNDIVYYYSSLSPDPE